MCERCCARKVNHISSRRERFSPEFIIFVVVSHRVTGLAVFAPLALPLLPLPHFDPNNGTHPLPGHWRASLPAFLGCRRHRGRTLHRVHVIVVSTIAGAVSPCSFFFLPSFLQVTLLPPLPSLCQPPRPEPHHLPRPIWEACPGEDRSDDNE